MLAEIAGYYVTIKYSSHSKGQYLLSEEDYVAIQLYLYFI